jgi:radical SAM-linked protein
MVYRPVRQRSPESIMGSIEKDLLSSGYRDVGFLSLNACDYPPLQSLISFIVKNLEGKGVFVSLPSLRIESIQNDFLEVLAKLPKSGFTIAPEAGSSKLKKVINKNMTEEELLNTARSVVDMGWDHIKAYFMIGLPKEDESDIEAIVDTAYKIQKSMPGKRKRLTVSVSNFVPKPHTPFQWEQQLCAKEFEARIAKLSRSIRGHNMSLKWGDASLSHVEGILARGDKRIGELVLRVYEKGEIFTSWNSEFDFSKWKTAMDELDIDGDDYLAERSLDLKLPWDNISSGVEKEWLKEERKKAYDLDPTPDCTVDICSNCGVCQKLGLTNVIQKDIDKTIDKSSLILTGDKQKDLHKLEKKARYRCFFQKTGKFKWMGHFELMNAVEKAVIREDLPVCVSAGYNPRPLLSFSTPVSSGAESLVEIVDIVMFQELYPDDLIKAINRQIPKELEFKKVKRIDLGAKSINQEIEGFEWQLGLDRARYPEALEHYQGLLSRAMEENAVINITRKGKLKSIKIFDYIEEVNMSICKDSLCLDFKTCFINEGTKKPAEFIESLIPGAGNDIKFVKRTGVKVNGIYVNN